MPRILIGFLVGAFVFFAIVMAAFTFQKCGVKALFLGNGATYAAMSGMCE